MLAGLGCALVVAQAVALPDLARGRDALQRGDLAAAEADLVPLAEKGYVDAMVGLARLYAEQETPDGAARAAHWYRRAAEKDPSLRLAYARNLVRAGINSNPQEIEKLLKQLIADNETAAYPLQLRLYRELPQLESHDKVAVLAQNVAASKVPEERLEAIAWYRANRLVKPEYDQALSALCERDRKIAQECYADLTRHFRAQNDPGALAKLRKEALERYEARQMSPETLERVARYLAADDMPGKPANEAAYALLTKIENPTPTVLARRARLLLSQPGLDPNVKAEALLTKARELGSAEATLQLGRLYLDESNPAADPALAEKLLREAAQYLPAAHTWLGRLYERGYLGMPQPERALEHYLKAARAGNSNADLALSRMYWSSRGVKVDPALAYSFARLAEHQGHPGAPEYLLELRRALSQDQIDLGQQFAHAEWSARLAASPAVPQDNAQLANAEKQQP
jgi:alginate biosynthesis protein AlgK